MHDHSVKEVFSELKSSEKGLNSADAKKRLSVYGKNELKKKKGPSSLQRILSQFNDPVIYVLLAAVALSLVVREFTNAIVISSILVLNAIFGFIQEYKAEQAIALLMGMETRRARVLRDGIDVLIDTADIVPGDIILLEPGDKIPADARIFFALDLKTNEAILTGESDPVLKSINALPPKTPLAERSNMLFAGTIVVDGRAKAVVTATDENTEMGKIAELVEEVDGRLTPLQNRLKGLGKWLAVTSIVFASLIIPVGLLRHIGWYDLLMQAISLAVSAVPEGLPAVVTICLALGAKRMIKRNAIVKRLKSVEALGSVTVICSDKTGTITKNEMTVTEIFSNGRSITVTGSGYDTKGSFLANGKLVGVKSFELLIKAGASCNNATLEIGDPTERALLVLAEKAHVKRDERRIGEISFSSDRKYMLTRHDGAVYVKGALEKVVGMCSLIAADGRQRRMTKEDIKIIHRANEGMAGKALRVLAIAAGSSEKNLVFLGLAGMIDPPRKEVKDAIRLCRLAGIRPLIITGDQKLTSIAIAKSVGITGDALMGDDIDDLSDEELRKIVKDVSLYCRTTSEHKVRILNALQANGEIVAMTGDGVNDAPALKKADVGVAMNIKGTDVTKDVADIVLVDDNFASIVGAVREGRVIYDNIKKFLKFLLSTSFDEIALVLTAIIIGLPLPLLPIQILWINLVTNAFPALALSVDNASSDVMTRKPRPPKESILHGIWFFLISASMLAFILSMIALLYGIKTGSIERTRTLVLTTAILCELFIVFSARSDRSFLKVNPFSNKYLVGAVFVSFAAHLAIIYSPLHAVFGIVPLSLKELLAVAMLSSSVFVVFESEKLIRDFLSNKSRA